MTSCINWIQKTTTMFRQNNIDAPKLSAELILCHVLNITRIQLITYPFTDISITQLSKLDALVQRRKKGEPIAYLLGKKEFFSRNFKVNSAILIPRPETELLVEFILEQLSSTQRIYFADLGTGSGCIAITLTIERPHWKGIAVDISYPALQTAIQNSLQHNVNSQLQHIQADFTKPIFLPNSLDLYISNPPYISRREHKHLSKEIRHFEPFTALVPIDNNQLCMDTGLEYFKKLIEQANYSLKPDGMIILEHGDTQCDFITTLLKNNNWRTIQNHKDLAGINRFITAYKIKNKNILL